jgi:hypothetical protein
MGANENQIEGNAVEQTKENGPTLLRGQFSRPTLLFKARAPKFSAGKVKSLFSLPHCYF